MSADRSKVYEHALTPLDLLRARGASKKEIDAYIKNRDNYFLKTRKK